MVLSNILETHLSNKRLKKNESATWTDMENLILERKIYRNLKKKKKKIILVMGKIIFHILWEK